MIEGGAKRVLLGVTLAHYATFLAGRSDGLPLGDLVTLTGVQAAAWAKAEHAWGERLLDDLEADGPLAEELRRGMIAAQRRWTRPLPPLDTDLRAYLDFKRAYALPVDAEGFLAARGMRPSDMIRLDALWSERLDQDTGLSSEAVAILAEEPREPVTPAPEPARLRDMEARQQ
jgi:hypothetical protein